LMQLFLYESECFFTFWPHKGIIASNFSSLVPVVCLRLLENQSFITRLKNKNKTKKTQRTKFRGQHALPLPQKCVSNNRRALGVNLVYRRYNQRGNRVPLYNPVGRVSLFTEYNELYSYILCYNFFITFT